MKFIHLDIESWSSETVKHWRFSITNIEKLYTYLYSYKVNENETMIINFRYKKQKRKIN